MSQPQQKVKSFWQSFKSLPRRTRIYLGLGGMVFALAGDHLAKILEQKYPNTNPLIPDDNSKTLSSKTPVDDFKRS
ncbi:3622_t:CDS:2 [Racocetra persica]|uniref:3622_t:CDS:1 n=1 Tax=Racocetra persica TaxID=160502 RepID=A0ACA9RFZ8_9GLOM|nr:3622_t:CDS:2 [Racocetra persica]